MTLLLPSGLKERDSTGGIREVISPPRFQSTQNPSPAPLLEDALKPLLTSEEEAETLFYWIGRVNLTHLALLSGMGEPAQPSTETLRRLTALLKTEIPAGYSLLQNVYSSAYPLLDSQPTATKKESWRWSPAQFEKSYNPEAIALTIVKLAQPQFHLQYHDTPEDQKEALLGLASAMEMASFLYNRLRDEKGQFIALPPHPVKSSARYQSACLWAFCALLYLTQEKQDNYFYQSAKEILNAKALKKWAGSTFQTLSQRNLSSVEDLSLAIEAIAWFSAVSEGSLQRKALALLSTLGEKVLSLPAETLEALGFKTYALYEVYRATRRELFQRGADFLITEGLEQFWKKEAGAYLEKSGETLYTLWRTAGLMMALNAGRQFGGPEARQLARSRFTTLGETLFLRSGLQRASGMELIPEVYRREVPLLEKVDRILPRSGDLKEAPVFRAEVRYTEGRWQVQSGRFITAPAMLLAIALVPKTSPSPDGFFPVHRLKTPSLLK